MNKTAFAFHADAEKNGLQAAKDNLRATITAEVKKTYPNLPQGDATDRFVSATAGAQYILALRDLNSYFHKLAGEIVSKKKAK